MTRVSEILGRSVVIREGGRQAGRIKDVVIDESGKKILGFIVSEGLFRSTQVAVWAGVQSIGPDSVIVATEASIVNAAEVPEIQAVLDKNLKVKGVKVQTTGGKDLGVIDDFEFDDTTAAVVGYELSGGLFADVFGGRTYLPAPDSIELGKDLAFVGPEAEDTIRKQSES